MEDDSDLPGKRTEYLVDIPGPKCPHSSDLPGCAWTTDEAATVRSKTTPRIKEDLIAVSRDQRFSLFSLFLLLFFSIPTLHLYEKPPGSLANAAILQLINNDCLGDLAWPEYFLLQRLCHQFIMTLSFPEFACSNKLCEKPRFIVYVVEFTLTPKDLS